MHRSPCATVCVCAARARLRKQHDINGGIPVLLSTEKPRCKLVSLADMEAGNPLDYQVRLCLLARVHVCVKYAHVLVTTGLLAQWGWFSMRVRPLRWTACACVCGCGCTGAGAEQGS